MHADHREHVASGPAPSSATPQALAAQAAQEVSVGLLVLDAAGEVAWANEALCCIAAGARGGSNGVGVERVDDGVTEGAAGRGERARRPHSR